MYGYSREEALGQISNQLLQTQYPGTKNSAFATVMETGSWEGRLVQTRKDGSVIVVDGKRVLDRDAGRILEVTREITDEIAHSERFKVLVESVKDYAIFLLDTKGRVSSWNEGARRIKGYQDHEILGRHFSAFYPQEDIEAGKPERELRMARESGHVEDEGWRVRKDGTRFFALVVVTALYDLSGKLTGYAKVTSRRGSWNASACSTSSVRNPLSSTSSRTSCAAR